MDPHKPGDLIEITVFSPKLIGKPGVSKSLGNETVSGEYYIIKLLFGVICINCNF